MKSTSTRNLHDSQEKLLAALRAGNVGRRRIPRPWETMRVTAVGQVYKDGRERLIDITAVEIDENSEETEPSTKSPTAL